MPKCRRRYKGRNVVSAMRGTRSHRARRHRPAGGRYRDRSLPIPFDAHSRKGVGFHPRWVGAKPLAEIVSRVALAPPKCRYWRFISTPGPGRSAISEKTKALIIRMATENRWHGFLRRPNRAIPVALRVVRDRSRTTTNPALQHYREPNCPLSHPATARGLLRQYLPKKSDLSEHSQAELNKIALRLNQPATDGAR